jgi:hypothetical protein
MSQRALPLLAVLSLVGCRNTGADAIGTERTRQALNAYAPVVSVVLCRESYDASPRVAQMSSQALVGLAGLVGAPYDTVTLDQLLALPADAFSSLWLSQCSVLSDARLAALAARLSDHLAQGGTVLLDGPLGIYRPGSAGEPAFRGSGDTEEILQVEYRGWVDVAGFGVRTAEAPHPLSGRPGWAPGTTLTQGLAEGTDVLDVAGGSRPGAHTLLQLSAGGDRWPYAVLTQPTAGRVLAISGYGQDSGAASPFRNDPPSGFFDNQLLPRLIDATEWLLGGAGAPVVGLQPAHAPLSVIVRLDGDVSDDRDSTEKTLDYLLELGRQTGVATAYGIVSAFAAGADWDGFSPAKMEELERLGGAVGSHSHTHNDDMSASLDEPGWDTEVRHSLQTIREHFASASFRPDVDVFINPGETIAWRDYPRFFQQVRAYFTHGFELSVPYTSGISGFDRPSGSAVALFGNTPVPDFQWFYDPTFHYSVGEATELQRKILGYFQNRIGRGAIYNQMWHDYAIAGNPPDHDPGAGPFDVFFDAIRDHFATARIYAPSIDEAAAKLAIAQRSRFIAQASDGALTIILDLSRLSPDERAHLAGMGLRIQPPGTAIVAVELDGIPHAAFTPDTVILPPATAPSLTVKVSTGDAAAAARPRLTYLSKAPAAIAAVDGTLRVQLAQPGLATRFCLVPPARHVLIGADRYLPEGSETCGGLQHGSTAAAIEARPLDAPADLSIVASDRRILGHRAQDAELILDLAAGKTSDRLRFRATSAPAVEVDGRSVTPLSQDGAFLLPLDTSAAATVTFRF